jgi:hypothetical protein
MSGVRRPSILAATALLLLCLTGCEGGTLLDGTITDMTGKPVPSAIITLEVIGGNWHKAQKLSNDHGVYEIGVVHYPERTDLAVTVSKEGFEPFMKKFASKGTHQHLNVKLKPAGAPGFSVSQ